MSCVATIVFIKCVQGITRATFYMITHCCLIKRPIAPGRLLPSNNSSSQFLPLHNNPSRTKTRNRSPTPYPLSQRQHCSSTASQFLSVSLHRFASPSPCLWPWSWRASRRPAGRRLRSPVLAVYSVAEQAHPSLPMTFSVTETRRWGD